MARTIKVLFTLMGLLLVTNGWILYASSSNTDRVHQVETAQARLSQDMDWIKATLVEIKTEVKRERK
jgi:hypothetical protein